MKLSNYKKKQSLLVELIHLHLHNQIIIAVNNYIAFEKIKSNSNSTEFINITLYDSVSSIIV